MPIDIHAPSPETLAFWAEREFSTLTTLRPDGSPHSVVVGVTYDPEARIARVITRKHSRKVANILAAQPARARVSASQKIGPRWMTLEGEARVRTEPDVIQDAVDRYAQRYGRTPNPDPARVVIEIAVHRAIGMLSLP
ncbi:TIGR03618 family F420-dependent PPOX class oxidoreductase [Streptomyces roseifaciens]